MQPIFIFFFNPPVQFATDQKGKSHRTRSVAKGSIASCFGLGRIPGTDVQDDWHPYKIWGINAGLRVFGTGLEPDVID